VRPTITSRHVTTTQIRVYYRVAIILTVAAISSHNSLSHAISVVFRLLFPVLYTLLSSLLINSHPPTTHL
jgi:hypothetical protein